MNLTDNVLASGILDIMRDSAAIILPGAADACSITAFNVDPTDGQWRVDINGSTIIDIPNFAGPDSFVILAVYDVTPTSEAAELTFIGK